MRVVFLAWCLCSGFSVFSQATISGIVADSLTLEIVPNAHISIKHKGKGTVTDEKGYFKITANTFDTLVFSSVGYLHYELPVLVDETDILILMSQDVIYLHQITVTDKPFLSPLIQPQKPFTYHKSEPVKLASASGFSLSYFSRQQKEKRKLQKLLDANEKVKGYVSVISRPEFKIEVMKRYRISEDEYYNYILQFNQTNMDRVTEKTPAEINKIMHRYFCAQTHNCP